MNEIMKLARSTDPHKLQIFTSKPENLNNSSVFRKDQQIKKIKEVQQISCLYSEHIYKSLKKDEYFETQLQKYKSLYENQKKHKVKLLSEQRSWNEQKKKLMKEREVILFALDNLTLKAVEEEEKQKEMRMLDIEERSKHNRQNSRMSERNEMKSGIRPFREAKNSTYNSNQCSKISFSKFKGEENYIESKRNSSMAESAQKTVFSGFDKLKMIKKLKQKLKITNNNLIDEIFDESDEKDKENRSKIIQDSEQFLKFKEEKEILEIKIIDLERQVKDLKTTVVQKNCQITRDSKTINQLKEEAFKLQEQTKYIKEQIFLLTKTQAKLQKVNATLKEQVTELESQMKLTQEEYSRKQEKEKHCVQILQKFSKELKLSDEKIQQFLSTQFGEEAQKDVLGSKKTYHEHLSYILHLCKKKETVYENLIQQFKERIKENDFRIVILEKRVKTFNQVYLELKDGLINEISLEELGEIVKKFKK